MGAFLEQPLKEKNPEDGQSDLCNWGLCSMQGWRTSQEDAHIATKVEQPDGNEGMLFCVFDGHGGRDVSKFAGENFTKIFINTNQFKEEKYDEALKEAFRLVDE